MDANYHIRRAELLMERRRYDAAMKELFAALELEPENPDVFENLSWNCFKQKMHEEAYEWAEKVVVASPDYYGGYYYMAINLAAMGRIDAAKKNINEALNCHPNWAPAWGYKASLYNVEERWAEAEVAARKGLEIDPDSPVCFQELNAALTKMRAKGKLKENLKIALERNPDDATTHISAGWSLLETGKIKQARAHFETALAKDPEDAFAREGLLEAVKAGSLLYRVLLRFDFAVAAQTYENRRAIMLIATLTFIVFWTVLSAQPSVGWALVFIPLTLVVFMMWFVKWLGNMVVYFFSKRYKFLVTPSRLNMSDAANHGFSIALFLLCFGVYLEDFADFRGVFVMSAAEVFFITFLWRRYYNHILTAPAKNARRFTLGLTVVALCMFVAQIITGEFFWFGALVFMGIIYLWAMDKIYSWKVFN